MIDERETEKKDRPGDCYRGYLYIDILKQSNRRRVEIQMH